MFAGESLDRPFVFVVLIISSISLLSFFILYKNNREAISMALGLTTIFLGIYLLTPFGIRAEDLNELGVLIYLPLVFPLVYIIILVKWLIRKGKEKVIGHRGVRVNFLLDLFLLYVGIISVIYIFESFFN